MNRTLTMGSPSIEMKFMYGDANWYIMPSPIIKPPTGIANSGFTKTPNAIRKAMSTGSGAGKSGINDILNVKLTNATADVTNLSDVGSRQTLFLFFLTQSLLALLEPLLWAGNVRALELF